jgi:hypothetical protein
MAGRAASMLFSLYENSIFFMERPELATKHEDLKHAFLLQYPHP